MLLVEIFTVAKANQSSEALLLLSNALDIGLCRYVLLMLVSILQLLLYIIREMGSIKVSDLFNSCPYFISEMLYHVSYLVLRVWFQNCEKKDIFAFIDMKLSYVLYTTVMSKSTCWQNIFSTLRRIVFLFFLNNLKSVSRGLYLLSLFVDLCLKMLECWFKDLGT